MSDSSSRTQVLGLMAQIVSAHVSHNAVRADALPGLIQSVYATLSTVGAEPVQAEKQQPAVPIKRSVFPDYIVCLEDGKKLKMLKRHLQTSYGMTPEQYRERWGLSPDYPMVAPNYAERRSDLAKKIGLGRKRPGAELEFEADVDAEAEVEQEATIAAPVEQEPEPIEMAAEESAPSPPVKRGRRAAAKAEAASS